MSYKALLFCPDERTARVVTQVLSELEFQVEACNEPFAAVKKLTAEHFDALVADCENEQNATLLFKSARNSEFNQASLSVAVVEGQSGVAQAFRIGANLVLTKPINVEQSKGTLRVARGLLRKNETAKTSGKATDVSRPSAPLPSQPISAPAVSAKPAFLTHAAPLAPAAATGFSSAFELEKEPVPETEPTEAALLESMPDPLAKSHVSESGAAAKQYPWQHTSKLTSEPMARTMSTALRHAAEATGKTDSGISVGYGAAAAPAKDPSFEDEISAPMEELQLGSSGTKLGRIAAIVLLAAASAAIYRAGALTHWHLLSLSLLQRTAVPVTKVASPSATPPPGPSLNDTLIQSDPKLTAPLAASQKPSPTGAAAPPVPGLKKPEASPHAFDTSTLIKNFGDTGSSAIVVNRQTPKPASRKSAPVEAVEPTALDALRADSSSSDNAISGLVSMPSAVPTPGPQTLRISQGVSQALLIKKVAPVYPARAIKTRTQGAVQLLATISKNGEISKVMSLSGDPLLAQAAMDAVKQWKYKPYLLDSQPMDIQTQITVNFKLP